MRARQPHSPPLSEVTIWSRWKFRERWCAHRAARARGDARRLVGRGSPRPAR